MEKSTEPPKKERKRLYKNKKKQKKIRLKMIGLKKV
jgi:hypothetical protein